MKFFKKISKKINYEIFIYIIVQSANIVPQLGHLYDFQNDLQLLQRGNPALQFLQTAVALTKPEPHFAHFPLIFIYSCFLILFLLRI